MIQIIVFIDEPLLDELEAIAKENGFSRSKAARELMKRNMNLLLKNQKTFNQCGYYNDKNGILRSRKRSGYE